MPSNENKELVKQHYIFGSRNDLMFFRRPFTILVIIALEFALAILGFASGLNFLLDPSGKTHGMDTSILVTTPVGDFTSVGLFFILCFGVLPSVTIYGLWKLPRWKWTDFFNKWTRKNWAWTSTVFIGFTLIVWIVVEVVLIGSPVGLPRFLQITMALLGVVFIVLTMLPRVRTYTKFQGVV